MLPGKKSFLQLCFTCTTFSEGSFGGSTTGALVDQDSPVAEEYIQRASWRIKSNISDISLNELKFQTSRYLEESPLKTLGSFLGDTINKWG